MKRLALILALLPATAWAVSVRSPGSGSGSGIANVVEDTTPQLGGDLDVNGSTITSAGNGDVVINPAGTGQLILGDGGTGETSVKVLITTPTAPGHDHALEAWGQTSIHSTSTASTQRLFDVLDSAGQKIFHVQEDGKTGVGTGSPTSTLSIVPHAVGHGIVVRESDDGNNAITMVASDTRGKSLYKENNVTKIQLDPTSGSFFDSPGLTLGAASVGPSVLDVTGASSLRGAVTVAGSSLTVTDQGQFGVVIATGAIRVGALGAGAVRLNEKTVRSIRFGAVDSNLATNTTNRGSIFWGDGNDNQVGLWYEDGAWSGTLPKLVLGGNFGLSVGGVAAGYIADFEGTGGIGATMDSTGRFGFIQPTTHASSTTFLGAIALQQVTKADVDTLAAKEGSLVYVTDHTNAVKVCVSTGNAASDWGIITAPATTGCGTNE